MPTVTTVPSLFLTAGWRHLAMLNYPVDPAVVRPYVPAGTELDFRDGRTYLSIVGFLFLDTRVLGLGVPFHRHFAEVNLRFYVRRRTDDGDWRRGVVFIKEIVPRRMVTLVARWVYNENYVTLPMRHEVRLPAGGESGSVRYEWYRAGRWNGLAAEIAGEPQPLGAGSEEEFIAEHYWGYTRLRDGTTAEYAVEHPSWRVWTAKSARLDCDVAGLYGPEFAPFLHATPSSAFVADGSALGVRRGTRLG
jgi:uncharacterized protein YqjF (DUF2071 family)